MGNMRIGGEMITTSLLKEFIEAVVKKYGIKYFIETGTHTGQSTNWASTIFKYVYSCELSKYYYDLTLNKYRNKWKNVRLFNSSSDEMLNELLVERKIIDGSSVFWLDAHYSGGETSGGDCKHPLLKELNIIFRDSNLHFIFIDDVRYMFFPIKLDKPDQWPSIQDIFQCINYYSLDDVYRVFIASDQIIIIPHYSFDLLRHMNHTLLHYHN